MTINPIKIAVVDDHELLRNTLSYILGLAGHNVVIQACNGKDFFDRLTNQNAPDVCILDLNMPVMDGYETIDLLRKSWPEIKIVVYSMNIENSKAAKLINADAILSKSGSVNQLKNTVLQLYQEKAIQPSA